MMPDSASNTRFFLILAANAREAVESLARARLRTVLGLVGIMIGISSVITMVSLGEIAKEQARKEFETLGTDIMFIRKSFQGPAGLGSGSVSISLKDAVALAGVDSISKVAPKIQGHGEFYHVGKRVGRGSVQGVTAAFADVNLLSIEHGRFVSDFDVDRHFCVIGASIAQAMRRGGAEQLVGETIEVNHMPCNVIGVLKPKVENYALPVQGETNEAVFLPITTSRRVLTQPEIDSVIARSRTDIYRAVADVRLHFHKRAPKLKLEILTAKELIAQIEKQMGIFTLLLGAIGSIALIVGGIGIMNIMLVSVAERRREIAIRRALGARRLDIQNQFLIESVILTMTGGVLGILLGLLATWGICRFNGWEFFISGLSVMGGAGTAAATGLFFGFQPARQAAQLDPIAGLQSE